LLLSGGTAIGLIAIAQPGCMPDFNKLSAEWQPAAGTSGHSGHGGTGGTSGQGALGGTSNGGMSNGGTSNGGMLNGGKGGKGGSGAHPSAGHGGSGGTTGGTGAEAGVENAGNGGVNEAGTTSLGGTGGSTGGTGGTGGSSATGGTGGEAGGMCDPGFTTCPGTGNCETSLADGNPSGSTVTDCGACGVTCSLTNAASAKCNNGTCKPTCTGAAADCNASTANDGCEADLTSTATCGKCGHACSKDGAPTTACTDGVCVPTCAAKYLDCTTDTGANPDDGCETYTDGLTTCGGTTCGGGTACNPDQVCNSGTCGPASGLVAMSIPFTASGQGQRYADKFPSSLVDLAGSKVTLRMYAPGATNGYVNLNLTDSSFKQGPITSVQFSTLSAGWTDVDVPTNAGSNGYDASHSYQVTIEVYTSGTGPWANPTVIYLDSVWTANLTFTDTFDTTTGNMVASSLLVVSGSSYTWTASVP
jgi:hypothetical protein